MTTPKPPDDRQIIVLRALKRYRSRVHRVLEARRRDLAEAERAPEFRMHAEALITYLAKVPARAASVYLDDPARPGRTLSIELDPRLSAQANAARYFKRAARAARGLKEIPTRIAQAEREQKRLGEAIERLAALAQPETDDPAPNERAIARQLHAAIALIPVGLRVTFGLGAAATLTAPRASGGKSAPKPPDARAKDHRAPSSKLQPRRVTTSDGWEVLIGRSNEGNDYLTLHMARPEDYWFHVHGAAGSHVVLRRGKGKNEPSKQTIEEVAAWTAFHSKARTAGKVPVIVTRKKYVRKPRGSKPGLVTCEREKTLMVRPREPEKDARAGEEESAF